MACGAQGTAKPDALTTLAVSVYNFDYMAKSPRKPKLRYKKGQEIVYPLQGVGKIVSIEERAFRSSKLLYYIIYLEVSDMTIMVPVERADELGIRPIVDRREANKALRLITEDFEPVTADWKARYQTNLDLLKKGSVLDIATVVRALYHRSRIKELPILERKLYDSALKLLVDEISFSLQKGKEEVEELVLSKLGLN
jgi:CarD family transcriptional regulator